MTIVIFLVGILIGAVIVGFAMLDVMDKPYTGGRAAGRVHHKKSWEEQLLFRKSTNYSITKYNIGE